MNAKAEAKIAGAESAEDLGSRALSKAPDPSRRTLGQVKETSRELRENGEGQAQGGVRVG